MTWSDFYLLCFIVGFTLSVLSFLGGAAHIHLPTRLHLPFHGGHHASGMTGRGMAGRGLSGHGTAHVRGGLSWFNAMTIMTFLAWFGGIGYILSTHSRLVAMVALSIAIVAGFFAASVVFKFMARIVKVSDAQMLDWDYRIEGTVGTISSPVREDGTGEMIFEQRGVRKSVGARSEDGTPLPNGTEVAITRYENGIAYVKKWEEFTK
jgi:membrane protein implicated in regulation of membrane protease activity